MEWPSNYLLLASYYFRTRNRNYVALKLRINRLSKLRVMVMVDSASEKRQIDTGWRALLGERRTFAPEMPAMKTAASQDYAPRWQDISAPPGLDVAIFPKRHGMTWGTCSAYRGQRIIASHRDAHTSTPRGALAYVSFAVLYLLIA